MQTKYLLNWFLLKTRLTKVIIIIIETFFLMRQDSSFNKPPNKTSEKSEKVHEEIWRRILHLLTRKHQTLFWLQQAPLLQKCTWLMIIRRSSLSKSQSTKFQNQIHIKTKGNICTSMVSMHQNHIQFFISLFSIFTKLSKSQSIIATNIFLENVQQFHPYYVIYSTFIQ